MNRFDPFVLFAGRDLAWSRSLRAELRHQGAQILTATTLPETLDLAARLRPELIVLEDDFAPFDCAFLLLLIRHRSLHSRVALVTSGPIHPLQQRSRALGLVYCGARPANPAEVGDAVTSWLQLRRAEGQMSHREAPRILCVDDDRAFLDSLERLIRQRGYQTSAFDDPAAAIEALQTLAPDMAIIDVMMPGMDGLELTREIRGLHGPRFPVVLLTARSRDGDIVDGYRQGADFYLTKPCDPQDILNVVDYLVGDLDERERRVLQTQL